MKIINTLLSVLITGSAAFSQNETDVLRYSQHQTIGTARYVGMGGAFGALGGDLSAIHTNPASAAIYRSSEFSFSPSIFVNGAKSLHYQTPASDSRSSVKLSTIGFVLTDKGSSSDYSGWSATQFAVTFKKINNYNDRIFITGTNMESSMLQDFNSRIQGQNPSDIYAYNSFDAGLAWKAYLLNPMDSLDTTTYQSMATGGVHQQKSIIRSGGMNELSISLGANYDNKLFMGMTIGFPMVNYTEEAIHIETDEADTIAYLQSFQMNETFHTSGTGFNIKLGVILRPNSWIRIGGAFHSPTYLNLSDAYSSYINADFDSVPEWSSSSSTQYLASSPDGKFDYRITTPLRLMGSMAFILQKKGLISMDYEWLDYTMGNLSSDLYGFSYENSVLNQKYGSASNVRVGAEWRELPFSLRAGFGLQGSPYNSGNLKSKTTYSLGLGIREKAFFIDFAYVFSQYNEDYYLYSPAIVAASTIEHSNHQIQSTLGFKF
jgi:hypothetical protein